MIKFEIFQENSKGTLNYSRIEESDSYSGADGSTDERNGRTSLLLLCCKININEKWRSGDK